MDNKINQCLAARLLHNLLQLNVCDVNLGLNHWIVGFFILVLLLRMFSLKLRFLFQ